MGQLFARSRQRGPIAARYADELKRRIGSATGVDWHLDDAAFCAAMSMTNAHSAPALAALLAHARSLAVGAARRERAAPPRARCRRVRAPVDWCASWMIA